MKQVRILNKIQITPTTLARKNISGIIDDVKCNNSIFVIGRRNKPEVILIKFPQYYDTQLSDETNINANSPSFKFLENEPDLYSVNDLIKKYV